MHLLDGSVGLSVVVAAGVTESDSESAIDACGIIINHAALLMYACIIVLYTTKGS